MVVDSGLQQEQTALDGAVDGWGAQHKQSRAGLGMGGSGSSSARVRGGFLMELGQLKSYWEKISLLLRNLCPAPTCKLKKKQK